MAKTYDRTEGWTNAEVDLHAHIRRLMAAHNITTFSHRLYQLPDYRGDARRRVIVAVQLGHAATKARTRAVIAAIRQFTLPGAYCWSESDAGAIRVFGPDEAPTTL